MRNSSIHCNLRRQSAQFTALAILVVLGLPTSTLANLVVGRLDGTNQSSLASTLNEAPRTSDFAERDDAPTRFNPLNNLLSTNIIRDASDAEYPKPDFSEMEKWYEIVKWEYKVFDRQLYVVVKAKEESRPYLFEMRYEDADGVIILETTVGSLDLWGARVGEPLKLKIITPSESQMDNVKKVHVFRQKG